MSQHWYEDPVLAERAKSVLRSHSEGIKDAIRDGIMKGLCMSSENSHELDEIIELIDCEKAITDRTPNGENRTVLIGGERAVVAWKFNAPKLTVENGQPQVVLDFTTHAKWLDKMPS